MNELKTFDYNGMNVRTVELNSEPWFVLKDVCEVLGISKYRDVAARLDEDERGSFKVDTLGGAQEMTVINESGLYNVILRSDKPEAKPFRKWVTAEVLPSIRKHGAYMTDKTLEQALTSPDFLIKLATELKTEREKRAALETKVEQDKPKVLFADAVECSKTSILIGDLAKLLRQNGVDIGQKRLFEKLRDEGYLMKFGSSKNMPTQRAMDMGLFEVKESTVNNPDGSVRITKTTKISGKGQRYFITKYLGAKQ
ncbi:MAG: phage antirepressor [Lachnospiraceae bacterium]|nr:phage antirepressor [Lachnospiraceae bacterium]